MNKRYVSVGLTFLTALLFVIYGIYNDDLIKELSKVTYTTLILVAVGKLTMHLINALFTKWAVEVFTKKISLGEALYLGILGAIGNFFGPILGGAGIRAVYLKKKHNLSYSNFTSTVLSYYLIIFIFNAAIAIISIVSIGNGPQQIGLLIIFIIWLLMLLLLFIFGKLPKQNSKVVTKIANKKYLKKIVKTIYEIENGWQEIRKNKKLLVKLMILAVLNFLTILFMSAVEFQAIGAEVSIAALCLYVVMVNVSLVLSFTPGAIGTREALMIIISQTLGITTTDIIAVSTIDRGVNFVLLIVLFLLIRNQKVHNILTSDESKV